MQAIEGGGNALRIVETVLRYPDGQGGTVETTRRATYVFRQEGQHRWLCTIDNSYGSSLLDAELFNQGLIRVPERKLLSGNGKY